MGGVQFCQVVPVVTGSFPMRAAKTPASWPVRSYVSINYYTNERFTGGAELRKKPCVVPMAFMRCALTL